MTKKDTFQLGSTKIPDSLKSEAYRDLAKPAVQHIGRWIGAVCGKLDKYSERMELENQAATETIKKHFEQIPEKYRTNPTPQITLSAEQGFLLSTGQPNLQELFINIIKSSCDTRTASGVLPSFVTIIQQLTPDEAKILKYCYICCIRNSQLPILQIQVQNLKDGKPEDGYTIYLDHFTNIGHLAKCEHPENAAMYITNLERLGTLTTHYDKAYVNKTNYLLLEQSNEAINIRNHIISLGQHPSFQEGMIKMTPFGLGLCKACSMDN